jgi:Domain of unknown function (DUF1839)
VQLDPATYVRHPLHRTERVWPETNCYVDLWIELLHSAGLDPLAVLPFTLATDVEGDQWTFLKCPLADLHALYGIEVFELNIWRSLLSHVERQLALGRIAIVDVDAFSLPDTSGTTYQTEHAKTSIGIHALDLANRRLGYFHNAGYYELGPDDFSMIFPAPGEARLPPYVEVAAFATQPPNAGRTLVAASIEALVRHLSRVPERNPFRHYSAQFEADLASLAPARRSAQPEGGGGPLADFHGYAFATFRQFGAAFELAGSYVRWLAENGERGLDRVAAACDSIATSAWTLQVRTARFVGANRSFDPAPLLTTMAGAWDEALAGLTSRYGPLVHHG